MTSNVRPGGPGLGHGGPMRPAENAFHSGPVYMAGKMKIILTKMPTTLSKMHVNEQENVRISIGKDVR